MKIKKLQKLFLTSTFSGAWRALGLPLNTFIASLQKVAQRRDFDFASFLR